MGAERFPEGRDQYIDCDRWPLAVTAYLKDIEQCRLVMVELRLLFHGPFVGLGFYCMMIGRRMVCAITAQWLQRSAGVRYGALTMYGSHIILEEA